MACRPTEVIHHDCDDVRPGAGLGAHQVPGGQQGDEDQPGHHLLCQVSLLSPVNTAPLPDLAQWSEAMNDLKREDRLAER